MSYSRFALYYTPPDGALARFGATWLGWDLTRGARTETLALEGRADVTARARRYGFHATLKPPFRLANACDLSGLCVAVEDLAKEHAPASCPGLDLAALGRFLALVPCAETADLERLAAACVTTLDPFRAPPDAPELARRRASGLSDAQEALLQAWGYPYVMQEFRFHMTLTGPLPPEAQARWQATLARHLPLLPAPFVIDALTLVGQRTDGYFEQIQRVPLSG